MKKMNVKRIIFLALAMVLMVAAFATFSVSASDEATPKVEIITNNVYYGDTLRLMYGVYTENAEGYDLSLDIYDNDYNFICTTVVAHTFDEQIPETYVKDGKECQLFVATAGVPAQDINKVYYAVAKLTKGDEVIESDSYEYSVLEYLFERLLITENVEPEKKEMYRALLSYADIADKVLDGTPEGDRISDYTYVYVKNGTIDGNSSKGVFKVGDVVSGADFEASIDIPSDASLSWQIETYDIIKGNLVDSKLVSDNDIGEIELAKEALIVTPVMTSKAYTLVTDMSQLDDGAQIIIAAYGYDYALSTNQKTNNRGQAAITRSGNTVTFGDEVQVITLIKVSEGKYNLQVGDKYLAATGTNKNYLLKSNKSIDSNSTFDISISLDGVAAIVANGEDTNNYMRYNSSSSLFSCYAETNTMKDICIYVLQ